MDVHYLLQGQRFLWNWQKAATNITKHGIRFEQACEVFLDPFWMIVDASQDEEARDAVIGMTESWEVLFVVHLERDGDAIRLISARRVTAKERNQYENGE